MASSSTHKITLLIALAIFIQSSLSFSLQGRWSVKSQYLQQNTNVSISFDKSIENNSTRIIYYMNIFSCRLIRYKYIVVDNEIYLTFDSFVADRYQCQDNQIVSIRNKIQKVFYFYIIANQLSLYGPNDQVLLNMVRIEAQNPNSLVGTWRTYDVRGNSTIDEQIIVTYKSFQLCNGLGVVEYNIPNPTDNKLNFTVRKTTGCSQNQIFTSLYQSVYYRWKTPILFYLYDKDYQETMTIRSLGNNIVTTNGNDSSLPIVQPSINQSIIQPSANPPNAKPQDQNNTKPPAQNITQPQTQPSTQPPTQSLTSQNKTKTDLNNQTQKDFPKNDAKAPAPVQQPPTIKPANTSTTSASPTSSTGNYKSVSQLPPISSDQFLGKWLIKDSKFDYTGYFFLNLPTRIMMYGSCNVYYSDYKLNNKGFDQITVQNTAKTCPQLSPQAKNLIENFKLWKYVVYSIVNDKKSLQLLDSNFKTVTVLEQV